ncbi:hypothetical protein C8J57DRAFT_1495662 [Mycena rebaudengoi]|nr:hypothetical protein C8J57DRAFT_1495662 [Mycena rebaudengoi]
MSSATFVKHEDYCLRFHWTQPWIVHSRMNRDKALILFLLILPFATFFLPAATRPSFAPLNSSHFLAASLNLPDREDAEPLDRYSNPASVPSETYWNYRSST